MTNLAGFIVAGASLGVDSILVRPKRALGPFTAQVTIEEVHDDDLVITEHPVEQGASVADHAYKMPARLRITCGWSNSPSVSGLFQGIASGLEATVTGVQSLITGNSESSVRDLYAKLLKLQADRTPFDVVTGKRVYTNMMFQSLNARTDRQTENALIVQATLKQIIIVNSKTVTVAALPSNQATPQATQGVSGEGNKSLIESSKYDATGGGRGFSIPLE